MPRPTAPEETTMISVPWARSAAICAQTLAMRVWLSSPIPDVSTPVPSFTTIRLGGVFFSVESISGDQLSAKTPRG